MIISLILCLYWILFFIRKLVPKTVAFEPNHQNFQRLSKNVEINNFNIV